jgi:hypothetical protein
MCPTEKEFTETDRKITTVLYDLFVLSGTPLGVLPLMGSWKNTMPDDWILKGLLDIKRNMIYEMEEQLSQVRLHE